MNGTQNQARLWAGYARIAAQLGFENAVYPFALDTPLAEGKSELSLDCAFSADVDFVAPQKYDKPAYYLWADGSQLSLFSFMVGPQGTYYLGDKQPMLPMQAVRCNASVTLGRGGYSETGEITETFTPYATSLPALLQFKREDIQRQAVGFGQQIGRAITHWNAFIPAHQGSILQDDILIDEATSVRYVIDAPDFTHMGYVCHIRLATI